MKNNRVCIYMQLYRNEPTMHKAIESVLQQTYKNIRFCILVSPATKQVVEEYASKDSRIEVFEGKAGESVTEYYNRQKKILQSGRDAYYTVIDADDWYDSHYVETLVNFSEQHETQITACGNYYVNYQGETVGNRQQQVVIWEPKDTAELLPYVYGFLRTIWGKLFTSDLILNQKIEELPDQKQYGGYGGDTLYMFNLLPDAKRLGICDQSLYYYRLSATGGSYTLQEGRLNSDTLVFYFVKTTLQKLGPIGERHERFLFHIYGNAMQDTIVLLLHQNIDAEEKTENFLYLINNELTSQLLSREKNNQLLLWEGAQKTTFAVHLYTLIFSNVEYGHLSISALKNYLQLFDLLNVNWQGAFTIGEFAVLLKEKDYLAALDNENFKDLFAMLLTLLPKLKGEQNESCLCLLRRLSKTIVLKPVLVEKKFVVKYAALIRKVNEGDYSKAFRQLHRLLSASKMPYYADVLSDLWINLAASLENAEEFIWSKEFKAELFLKLGDMEKARQQYSELNQLGINDENMKVLEKCFQQ